MDGNNLRKKLLQENDGDGKSWKGKKMKSRFFFKLFFDYRAFLPSFKFNAVKS